MSSVKKTGDSRRGAEGPTRERTDAISEWVWRTDARGVFTYSNLAVKSILGYEPAEIVGRSGFDFLTEEDTAAFRALLRESGKRRAGARALIARFRGKDGAVRAVELCVGPLLGAEGGLTGFSGVGRDVTAGLATEEAARESLANYKAVTDNSPTGIFILQDDKVVYANPRIARLMGYSPEEATSLNIWDLVHPDDRERVRGYYRARMAGEPVPEEYEVRAITKSGEIRHFELRATVIQYNGSPAVLDNVTDVTERSRAQAALRESEERLAKLNDGLLALGPDSIANINSLTALAGELLGADAAGYNRLEDSVFRSWGHWRVPEGFRAPEVGEGHLCYDVIHAASDQPRVIRNLQETGYAQTDPNVLAYGLRTYVGKAVKFGEKFVGSLCCVYRRDYAPGPEDLRLLGVVASAIATEERRRDAELALRESERFLQSVFDGIQDGISVSDRDLNILRVNRAMEKYYAHGMPLCGKKCYEVYREKGRETVCEPCPAVGAIEKKTLQMEIAPLYAPDGGTIGWFELFAFPLLDENGEVWGVVEHLRDITERKRAQEEVERLSRRYELVLNAAGEGIFGFDLQGTITFANPAAERMLGYEPGELLGKPSHETIHHTRPDGTPYPPEECPSHATCRDGRTYRITDEVFWRKDGTGFPVDYVTAPTWQSGEIVGAVGVFRDATERKRADEALRESEEKYRNLVETTETGYLIVDTQGRVVDANAEYVRQTGHKTLDEIRGRSVLEWTAPYDFERNREEVRKCAETGKVRNLVIDYIWADGTIVPIEINAAVIETREGPGIQTLCRDITERRQAEVALRESEERYRRLVDLSPDGISVAVEGRFVLLNEAMLAMHGATDPNEMIGKPVLDRIGPEYRERARGRRASLIEGRALSVPPLEEKFLRLDGSEFDVEVAATRIAYEGRPAVLAVVRDISERKRAEQERVAFEKRTEAAKRQFYRDTIMSVTGGKLDICEPPEVNGYIARALLKLTVRAPADVSGARHEVERFCAGLGLARERLDPFMMGVGEAITNAIKHARRGRVYAGRVGNAVWVGVADKGTGISSLILPKATLLRGYSTKPSLGLGYTIMLDVADRILLKTGERGTTVILIEDMEEVPVRIPLDQIPDTWGGTSL